MKDNDILLQAFEYFKGNEEKKKELMKFLHEGKGPQIEVLVNRNNRKNEMFHDDISICF